LPRGRTLPNGNGVANTYNNDCIAHSFSLVLIWLTRPSVSKYAEQIKLKPRNCHDLLMPIQTQL
jgi:hypothetical protein